MTSAAKKPGRVVCVGASAGGLEALIALFKNLPSDLDMAVVVIQHLEPQHKSALPEILARESSLKILEARHGLKVEQGTTYVIPPNVRMAIRGGRLELSARGRRTDGRHLPIDYFMTSLAKDQGEKAVAVVLSGTGADGMLGAKAVKAAGGLVLAQDERTAKYFGMPGSVIASGAADYVLTPADMARKLPRLSGGGKAPANQVFQTQEAEDGMGGILLLLRELEGTDFTHYKRTTMTRRIARRMAFHGIATHEAYRAYLKANPAEAGALRKDILIPVTAFFRDPAAFATLKKKVFPALLNKRSPRAPLRLWVPACSSGEEVYSLAISLYEYMEERRFKAGLQIFGTDLSDASIGKARAGLYGQEIARRVSPARLRRFFTRTEAGYKISKQIRELCIFARHDLTGDPPLSGMDVVSCRNLLIYLDVFLQSKALAVLHYALKPKSFLLLGTAESAAAAPGLFTVFDKKQKIFQKNPAPVRPGTAAVSPMRNNPETKKNKIKSAPPPGTEPGAGKKGPKAAKAAAGTGAGPENIGDLRKEFARTVQRLNAISEEKDTFNEELKAANEEIQSSNEELQSTNEELETSKEELQSTNEELLSLNEELQNKNAELAHLNSDLNNVFASTNVPLIIVGNDLRIKRFTPTARKVMNLIPADVGRPLGDIKLNLAIPGLEDTIAGVIEDMAPKESEVQDKEGRWYSVRIRPYRTVDNKIDGAVISLIDVDTIKKSRDEAKFSLEYTQAIIDTMREPLLVLDKGARVLSANRAFSHLFGLRPADSEGRLVYDLGAQWDAPGLRKLLEEVLPRKVHFNDFEMTFELLKAGSKTMSLNGRQIKPHGNASPLTLLVLEDITERKKAGDVLKRDGAVLEKLVTERSRELLELQAKLERARHLSDLGTLAATIAHELRNTLGAISAAEYNIRQRVDDPRIAGSLASITKKISEGERIISNVLSYSRIKTSQFEPLELNDMLALCAGEIKERAALRGTALTCRLAATEGLSLQADPVQINEVFSNILNNALDAAPKTGGLIELSSEVTAATATVAVKDNGEGMTEQELKKAMDPFFTTKAKGTGLGLAVCNQILILHDGSITLESEKGKGTTVRVTLPLHRGKNA